MGETLTEIAEKLKNTSKKVQLIYAFNGTGKTRLSREFKELIAPKTNGAGSDDEASQPELTRDKILYYNSFTEDLFYWDNDPEDDANPRLKIQPNSFTDGILSRGEDRNIISNFQRYTNDKLTPSFKEDDIVKEGKKTGKKTYPEVTFSLDTGSERTGNIKISKGEESNFVWSIFYTLLELVIEVLNVPEPEERETNDFDHLEYVFIDDPVSSLDENHLIELAVNLATLITSSRFKNESDLKFIITTHNPLFYNVLHNELKNTDKYLMKKLNDGTYELTRQPDDSPFSYHLYLKSELEKTIASGQISKYHFNFLRNILEKTSTFLGYERWGDLLPKTDGNKFNPYERRILNLYSHSKHAGEEVAHLTEDDKRILKRLVKHLDKIYKPDLKDDLSA